MLFDPLHLSRTDASVYPGADKFKEALKRLMDLIRREAPRHEIVRNLVSCASVSKRRLVDQVAIGSL
jgi:hypothetical protein